MEHDYIEYGGIMMRNPRKPRVIRQMGCVLDVHTHYSSPKADKERDIFGANEPGLFYNYSDRLWGWDHSKCELAHKKAAEEFVPKTGAFYERMLTYFHEEQVELRHIIAGCNRSNGQEYLVFGYIMQGTKVPLPGYVNGDDKSATMKN